MATNNPSKAFDAIIVGARPAGASMAAFLSQAGFRVLLKMYQPIWNSFEEHYLKKHGLTVEQIYDSKYNHGPAYVVAEALAEFDELFQKFRFEHMQLIHRTIGFGSRSLKGRPVEILEDGMRHKFFPELWEIRNEMTDRWGAQYGVKRDPIGGLH